MTDYYEAYRNELLISRMLTQATKIRDVYEDLQIVKFKERNFYSSILEYLSRLKTQPKEYDIEEMKEKYLILDWIATSLDRPS